MAACGGGSSSGGGTITGPTGPTITAVTVTPNPSTITIGTSQQFTATVAGTGSYDSAVTWSVAVPSGSTMSAGSITNPTSTSKSAGFFTTPYPAPATVTVTATSKGDPTKSGSVVVTLAPPATATGPALLVDAADQTHPINPYIYGWNAYPGDPIAEQLIDLPVNRFGGDGATRYNYLLDIWNSASDWWFESYVPTGLNLPDDSQFNIQVEQNASVGAKTLGTMPLIGWTTNAKGNCSFSISKYGAQLEIAPDRSDCGDGVKPDGVTYINDNDPTDTSFQIDESWTTAWVKYLVGKFGTAANGGVAIYDLDNEPTWWDAVHRDVHAGQASTPTPPYTGPFTYDEVTKKGLSYAAAIKAQDPSAEVSGPVIDSWLAYFYSKKDIETGWNSAPCFCYNGNPVDRMAHGDVPLIEYYLQQFQKSEATTGKRLLDYVDIHGYFAADGLGFALAGDTTAQQERLNSTRVFWDPTYTDPNFTDPDNHTSAAQPVAPQLIPRMQTWVARDYPGTKTAIDEYNWGGQDHINGALAQADILGIFGMYGLDLGALWGPPNRVATGSSPAQLPGLIAFEVYRNYDGNHSKFGDVALASTSANQGQLAVYGALRSSDDQVTVVVINKTFGDLTSTLSLANLKPNGKAKVFLYSSANIDAIAAQPDVTVTAPAAGGTASSIAATFPASSITLFQIPRM